MPHIPLFNLSRINQKNKQKVLKKWSNIIDKNEFTAGIETVRFEKKFASLCQTRYAIAVNSGTMALLVALKAIGIEPGDEVITTPVSFAATTDAISLIGAKPVFADIDPETGNIDFIEIRKKINPRTKAVLIVHLYGVPCNMDEISKVCEDKQLILIEDASHAHGSTYDGNPVGSFADVGCFSLYPSKTLGAFGNAGVITTNKKAIADKVHLFAHHGLPPHGQKYHHHLSGYNAYINNVQAAVLNVNLVGLENRIKKKIAIAQRYNKVFQEFDQPTMIWSNRSKPSLYVYSIQRTDRDIFRNFMNDNGIETGVYYPVPLHLQPSTSWLKKTRGNYVRAELFCDQTVSLPLYADLTNDEVSYIENILEKYLKSKKRMSS